MWARCDAKVAAIRKNGGPVLRSLSESGRMTW
jgi:hypothetical protein